MEMNKAAPQFTHEDLATRARKENGRKLAKFMKDKWNAYRATAAEEAAMEFENLLSNPLFVAGIMLYWGEGDKMLRGQLRITNTDPKMIRLFVIFLETIMKIPKGRIKAYLVLYPDLSDSDCKMFWATQASLPEENFIKSQYIIGRHPTKKLTHGVCTIYVSNIYQKIKILTWIDIFSKKYIMNP